MYPTFGNSYPWYDTYASYGTLGLTVTSPPQVFIEPFTLDQAISFLRLPPTAPANPGRDDDLRDMIVAARVQAELLQNRDLVVKSFDLSLDYWQNTSIELRPHLRTVDLVQQKDSTGAIIALAEGTQYVVDTNKQPGTISPPWSVGAWPSYTPWPSSSILIRFTAGVSSDDAFWSDTGATVKMGMRRLINEWFSNRLPLSMGKGAIEGYPDIITAQLSYGAITRVR